MDVSVIMASCNQGSFCRRTVESIHTNGFDKGTRYEIVVADDCSDDGSCDNLPDANVIRTRERSGCAATRKLAASHTNGDVIILTDPHCSFTELSLERLYRHAISSYEIALPAVIMENRGLVTGGRLQLSHRGIRVVRPKRVSSRRGLFGSIYAMRRDVYERLGRFPHLPGTWGRWEQCMSILAIRLGIPIEVYRDIECTHHAYRRRGTYPFTMSETEAGKNSIYVHAALLPDTYEDVWRTLILHYHGSRGGVLSEMLAPLDSNTFHEFKRFVQASSILSEPQFYMTYFRKQHPLENGNVQKALSECSQ